MNQETNDQGWQQMQSHVDQLLNQFLKQDYPAIEYKSSVAGLLQLPPKYGEQNIEELS